MNDRINLHVRRINEGLKQMNDLRKSGENAFSPTFKAWKQRVTQSLAEVFGKDHDYTRRFKGLSFWEMRMSIGQHRWSPLDQAKFENDFIMAEQLLSDVFEDFEIASPINQPTPEKIPVSGPTSPPSLSMLRTYYHKQQTYK